MARLAILCPGQGGQHPGMFDLALSDPATAAALAGWGVERAAGLAPPALPDSSEALHDNRVAQPLVVAATLAMKAAPMPSATGTSMVSARWRSAAQAPRKKGCAE